MEVIIMPAYLILFKYTQKGAAAIKESPKRVNRQWILRKTRRKRKVFLSVHGAIRYRLLA